MLIEGVVANCLLVTCAPYLSIPVVILVSIITHSFVPRVWGSAVATIKLIYGACGDGCTGIARFLFLGGGGAGDACIAWGLLDHADETSGC
jgi:hypothetical protein